MIEGTTVYLPVFVEGALLWSDDSHAAQGNGEINLTAIETAFNELRVHMEVIKRSEYFRVSIARGAHTGTSPCLQVSPRPLPFFLRVLCVYAGELGLSASSNLAWMPPKPPLLITST